MRIDQINGLSKDDFVATLGGIFEHSPWVAERAYIALPVPDLAALHRAMAAAMAAASREEQLALLRAHPDLAGKLARAGRLTEASTAEQASAGLDLLTQEEFEAFSRLNTAYTEKFGHPFIIAVRENTKAGILAAFERRLAHSADQEFTTALDQVSRIALHRLTALIEEA
ncbi:2-oxo-4-hydroxy-4-carboxy-5-ureidoimidazoline decarboxylase [Lacibacterium aquatile]|uniref:2-oxo-4-hydroxy-4-carboxy-5-ureidoimidazoline decarboxylase n=1 Tax=Lacibacterium aquatile TaxID=1168082 RepID=A0ABW5DVM9_9PROT